MLCGLHIHSVSSYLQVHPDLYSIQLSVVIVVQHSIISTKQRTTNNNKKKKKACHISKHAISKANQQTNGFMRSTLQSLPLTGNSRADQAALMNFSITPSTASPLWYNTHQYGLICGEEGGQEKSSSDVHISKFWDSLLTFHALKQSLGTKNKV